MRVNVETVSQTSFVQVGATVKRGVGMYLHEQLSIAPAFGIEVSRWCTGCRREMVEQATLVIDARGRYRRGGVRVRARWNAAPFKSLDRMSSSRFLDRRPGNCAAGFPSREPIRFAFFFSFSSSLSRPRSAAVRAIWSDTPVTQPHQRYIK